MNNARLQGIAVALAALAREHMEPDLAVMVMQSLSLTLKDFEKAGVEEYDLLALNPPSAK